MIKHITLLGSTGSIGTSASSVIDHLGSGFKVVALAAKSNIDLLEKQAKHFNPDIIAVYDEEKARELKKRLPSQKIVAGMQGIIEAASYSKSDIVLSAMSGTLGLLPTMAAIKAQKTVALANKEALVSGGELIMKEAIRQGVAILPVDSEHSALFQCLVGENPEEVSRLVLTASGGPFRTYSLDELSKVTREDALSHPTWKMGPKVTCDCSTLMNKGLEMIEASYLFNIPASKIDVVVHPQSIIHSMVEFRDGSMKAQMSAPDMKLPIQYAFTYPERKPGLLKPFDFIRYKQLDFHYADTTKFLCLGLAYRALEQGQSMPCYMNAANEVLVNRFLQGEIKWNDIGFKLEKLMDQHQIFEIKAIENVLEIDQLARVEAKEI